MFLLLDGLSDLDSLFFSAVCGFVNIFVGAEAGVLELVGAPTAFSDGNTVDAAALLEPTVAVADVAVADDVTGVFLAGTNPAIVPLDGVSSRVMGTEETSGISERGRLLALGSVGKSETPDIGGPSFLDLGFFFFFFALFSRLSIGGGSSSSLRRVRAAVILCAENV